MEKARTSLAAVSSSVPRSSSAARVAVLAGEAADLLDEFEELGALLPYEGLAQQVAQSADVGTQLGAGGRGLVGTAHRCGSLQW